MVYKMRKFNSMAIVLLLCIVAVQGINPYYKNLKICLEKVQLSEEEYTTLVSQKTFPDEAQSQKIKCISYCYLEIMGVLNAEGKADIEIWSSKYPMDAKQYEMLEDCITQHDAETDTCVYGSKMTLCYLNDIIKSDVSE